MARDVSVTSIQYLYIVRQNEPQKEPGGAAPAVTPPPATGPSAPVELAPKTEGPRSSSTAIAAASSAQPVLRLLADIPATEPTTGPAAVPPPAEPAPAAKPFQFDEPASQESTRTIRIPLDALRRGDLRYNIPLRARDLLIVPVPEAGEYYMGGHVQRPGAFTLTGRQITLKEAVVSAGMLDAVAIPQRTDIIRRIKPDHEIFVRVDLAEIFAGNQPDVYLKPYDQVMVGTNALAPFIAAARGAFRITYGFGFLYDRNFSSGSGGL